MLRILIIQALVIFSLSLKPSKFDFVTVAPVIGVLTQPIVDNSNYSVVSQSYVGFLQMAGARVVPIHWDSNTTVQDNIMRQINGLLFQGGAATLWNKTSKSLTPYAASGCRLLKQALEMNKRGDFFPVWGVCLGLELMVMCLTDNPENVLSAYLDIHENHALIFTNESTNTNFFGGLNSETYRIFQTMRVMHFNHLLGLKVQRFNSDPLLSGMFNNLAIDKDDFGEYFVSAIEGKDIPFFAVQFHPEKGPFEWYIYNNFPYIYEAIQSTWHLANYFVNHTRLNAHFFDDQFDLYHQLIYRTTVIDGVYGIKQYAQAIEGGYEQVYLFPIPIDRNTTSTQAFNIKNKLSIQ